MKALMLNILAAAIIFSFTSTAQAIPTLQLYMEGSTYDSESESWTLSTPGTFKLWVLGQGGVYDVKLAAAYITGETGTISLSPTTASASSLPPSITDTTTPDDAEFIAYMVDGTIPVMGSGDKLPGHGVYGPGTSWTEWFLGDFLETSDMVADMTADPLEWKDGQLNAYDVTVAGFSSVHFDAYDHTVLTKGKYKFENKSVFAPFSHDAEATPVTPVPEPGTMMLLGVGLLSLAIYAKRSRKS